MLRWQANASKRNCGHRIRRAHGAFSRSHGSLPVRTMLGVTRHWGAAVAIHRDVILFGAPQEDVDVDSNYNFLGNPHLQMAGRSVGVRRRGALWHQWHIHAMSRKRLVIGTDADYLPFAFEEAALIIDLDPKTTTSSSSTSP